MDTGSGKTRCKSFIERLARELDTHHFPMALLMALRYNLTMTMQRGTSHPGRTREVLGQGQQTRFELLFFALTYMLRSSGFLRQLSTV